MQYWIWLASCSGLSVRAQHVLLRRYLTPEAVFEAPEREISQMRELSPRAKMYLKERSLGPAETIAADCRRMRISILTWQDAQYPARLKNIDEPPLVLYYKGYFPGESMPVIGVVGTRNASPEGSRAAQRIAKELGCSGGVVATGMAAGIDSCAAKGALAAGSPVIGVLGGGVDVVYPAANRELYAQVERQGCLISEYPPGTRPNKWSFPRRNRIISGLSLGILVVEAPRGSGSVITADFARRQGRDLYAVPGSPEQVSALGSNELLMDGAMAVLRGWDILRQYVGIYPDLKPPAPEAPVAAAGKTPSADAKNKKMIDNPSLPPYIDQEKDVSNEEKAVLTFIRHGQQSYDDILAFAGLRPGDAMTALSMLELRGWIKRLPGDFIALQEI